MSAAFSQQARNAGADLVGSYHYFGEYGPAYEVLSQDGETTVLVRALESGETLSYPIENVRSDPEA